MGERLAVLERADEDLPWWHSSMDAPVAAVDDALLDEVDAILDELPEEGIQILPTAADAQEIAIGALHRQLLPPVARFADMPRPVEIGQRSIA